MDESKKRGSNPERLLIINIGIALLLCTTGCISGGAVMRAKGYTTDRVEPLKGDTVFSHRGLPYVIPQKHPERDTAEKMSPAELQQFPTTLYAFDPCPACYSLLLVTIPMDAATLPFQALYVGWVYFVFSGPWEMH